MLIQLAVGHLLQNDILECQLLIVVARIQVLGAVFGIEIGTALCIVIQLGAVMLEGQID